MQEPANRPIPHRVRWTLACLALLVLYAVVPVSTAPEPAVLVLRWVATAALLAVLAVVIRWQAVR